MTGVQTCALPISLLHFPGDQVVMLSVSLCGQPIETRFVHLQVRIIDQERFREDALPIGAAMVKRIEETVARALRFV